MENPALVAGRITAGVGTTALVRDPRIGAGLGGIAAFGDSINAIDNGIRNLEGLVPAAVGGQVPDIQNLQIEIPLSQNFNSSSAGGGFVLYPSKPNTNTLRSVYSK